MADEVLVYQLSVDQVQVDQLCVDKASVYEFKCRYISGTQD